MRIKRSMSLLAAAAALLSIAACAPSFSRELLDRVDRKISFSELQKNPEEYKGKLTLLGGVIIATRNDQEGSSIEVLETPLDRQGRPRNTDTTRGRFIIRSNRFLDATVYHQGKLISVIGEAAGENVGLIGDLQYRYPVVNEKEIKLWEQGVGPRFSFGLGIGVFHH